MKSNLGNISQCIFLWRKYPTLVIEHLGLILNENCIEKLKVEGNFIEKQKKPLFPVNIEAGRYMCWEGKDFLLKPENSFK